MHAKLNDWLRAEVVTDFVHYKTAAANTLDTLAALAYRVSLRNRSSSSSLGNTIKKGIIRYLWADNSITGITSYNCFFFVVVRNWDWIDGL